MSDFKVGDYVFFDDGQEYRVVAIGGPENDVVHGRRPVYRRAKIGEGANGFQRVRLSRKDDNLPKSHNSTSGQLPDRRLTRTEEAAATIPSTWVALANEVRRGMENLDSDQWDDEQDRADYFEGVAATGQELARLILEASS